MENQFKHYKKSKNYSKWNTKKYKKRTGARPSFSIWLLHCEGK